MTAVIQLGVMVVVMCGGVCWLVYRVVTAIRRRGQFEESLPMTDERRRELVRLNRQTWQTSHDPDNMFI